MNGTTWVLGGGGVGANAWETGMLGGLLDEGVAVDCADLPLASPRPDASPDAIRDDALVRTTTRR